MARIVNGVIVHDNSSGAGDDGSQTSMCGNQTFDPWMKWVLVGLAFFLFGLKGLLICGVGYLAYYLMNNNSQVSFCVCFSVKVMACRVPVLVIQEIQDPLPLHQTDRIFGVYLICQRPRRRLAEAQVWSRKLLPRPHVVVVL